MQNESLKLKLVSKLDFGKRSLSPKEFSLFWRMILKHFSKFEDAESFHWEDTTITVRTCTLSRGYMLEPITCTSLCMYPYTYSIKFCE